MADIDRQTYAYGLLREASRKYDGMNASEKLDHPELAAQIAIAHFLKLLTDSQVEFDGGGNVKRK